MEIRASKSFLEPITDLAMTPLHQSLGEPHDQVTILAAEDPLETRLDESRWKERADPNTA